MTKLESLSYSELRHLESTIGNLVMDEDGDMTLDELQEKLLELIAEKRD